MTRIIKFLAKGRDSDGEEVYHLHIRGTGSRIGYNCVDRITGESPEDLARKIKKRGMNSNGIDSFEDSRGIDKDNFYRGFSESDLEEFYEEFRN